MTVGNDKTKHAAVPQNSKLGKLRLDLCSAVENSLTGHETKKLGKWIDTQLETIFESDLRDNALRIFNEGAPAQAVVLICTELCQTAASIDRFDDSPDAEKSIAAARSKMATRKRPLIIAKTMIENAWEISEKHHSSPPLPGDPEKITNEEVETVNAVIEKAIRWNESHLLATSRFDVTLRLSEKSNGKPGRSKLDLVTGSLMVNLHDLFSSVGFSTAKSSRFIASWINHFGAQEHSWLTNYQNDQQVLRTPKSVETYLRRHNKMAPKKT